ncbi:MAG: hypothetical protein EZS28_047317 [Streblomastix strix]|uniref:Uncharacterized protein n=1 Tax=Streblomastix strix TaxID=222440 RepID=A0A5J4TI47_9EUKA|nr:MAG: hypothetical protein EZS28_047317 [Streblomastix strix]
MSSSFVPPHQDVPTLGNLGQTESSEVQTLRPIGGCPESQQTNEELISLPEDCLQGIEVKRSSRACLRWIQYFSYGKDQAELLKIGYARVQVIEFSTAGGTREQENTEIYYGLKSIINLFKDYLQGNKTRIKSFPPQFLFVKTCIEQIEEEGGSEEIESQLFNQANEQYCKGSSELIKDSAKGVKEQLLNYRVEKQSVQTDQPVLRHQFHTLQHYNFDNIIWPSWH